MSGGFIDGDGDVMFEKADCESESGDAAANDGDTEGFRRHG